MKLKLPALFRSKAAVEPMNVSNSSALVPQPSEAAMGGWLNIVRESFTGAWQRNMVLGTDTILTFSAIYTCISLISEDISKMRMMLTHLIATNIWEEFEDKRGEVLRKPNRYQTRIQFFAQWVVSKLIYGNTYVLKDFEAGVVVALYILDPRNVTLKIGDDGAVYYCVSPNSLAGVTEEVVLDADQIIHDRGVCLWHPLIGVSALYACAASSTQGIKIQRNSSKFFDNMSRPSGHLTSPGVINKETVARLKENFETNFGGGNIGRLLVTGDGLKYEPMTIPANEAQLVEQLKWTVEDVARCFKVPLYKLGGAMPANMSVAALNQDYYSQCLQNPIECIELLLDEGLGLKKKEATEFDLDALLRMDPTAIVDANQKGIAAGYLKPNEARQRSNLAPVTGGDTPYMQQQNYSLAALDARDSANPAPSSTTPAPSATRDAAPQKDADADIFDWDDVMELNARAIHSIAIVKAA